MVAEKKLSPSWRHEKDYICNFGTLYSIRKVKLILLRRAHSCVIQPLWMTQVSSCGVCTMCDHKGSTLLPDGSFEISVSRKRVPRGLSRALARLYIVCFFIVDADFQAPFSSRIGLTMDQISPRRALLSRLAWKLETKYIFVSNFQFYIASLGSFYSSVQSANFILLLRINMR